MKLLSQFPEFQAFKAGSRTERIENKVEAADSTASQTPLELLEAAHENIRAELAVELLDRIKKESPSLFERIVIELLVKMGYGGSRADAGQAIGRAGDEGLDGVSWHARDRAS